MPLAILQAIAQATLLSRPVECECGRAAQLGLYGRQPILPSLTIIIGMTAGTMFGVWLGQLLTEQGIGNGISLIIFCRYSGVGAVSDSSVVRSSRSCW